MKKRIVSIAFLAVSLCLCLLLSLGILFSGPAQPGANEQLAEAPVLIEEDGQLNTDFLSHVSNWIRDHFFLRQELISLDHWLSARLFRTSGDAGVILGTDGWLYYTDTLADFTGSAPMTDRELFAAANNLRLMADYCQAQGRQFRFMIAPNKNALYPGNMPDYGEIAQTTDAERLMVLLDEAGVPTIDLFDTFRQEDEILYFAHDSHWNTKGAALGADTVTAAFGIQSHYFSGDFSQTTPHDGDLYAMLYPAFTDPEQDYVYGRALNYSFTTSATRPDAIVLNTQGSGQKSLLAYRDSFGNLLFPFLADSFSAARFSRSTAYDLTFDADCVLVELVQRNLRYLTKNLPVLPAPQVQLDAPASVSGTVTVTTATRGDWLQVKGQLPETDPESPVYVICGDAVYEAFCMAEFGFGLHLSPDSQPESVMCYQGGIPVLYQLKIQS